MSVQSSLQKTALSAALSAASVLRSWSQKALGVEWKEDESPVTLADRDAHQTIMGILKESGIPVLSEEGRQIPYEERKSWKQYWLVDPLDGTKEFIKGRPEYTVNIALMENDQPVFGVVGIPEQRLIYAGGPGLGAWRSEESDPDVRIPLSGTRLPGPFRVVASRSHLSEETAEFIEELREDYPDLELVQAGSALKFCRLVEGTADLYPRYTPCMEWDTAAAHAILRAVGKEIRKAHGKGPLEYNKPNLLNPSFIAG